MNNECENIYENGKLSNVCTLIVLKNIKHDLDSMLSPMERDAIDKAIENTLTMEKLYIYMNSNE